MKPYYQDDAVTLYHGDCVDVLPALQLPQLGNELSPVLVTDPPYATINTFGVSDLYGKRAMQFDMDKEGAAIDDVARALAVALPLVNAFHLFCDPEHFGSIAGIARRNKFTPKPFARLKLCPPPPMPGNWWPSAFELAMYGYQAPVRWYFGDDSGKTIETSTIQMTYTATGIRVRTEKVDHPTQKWLPMIQYIVGAMAHPDSTVIDRSRAVVRRWWQQRTWGARPLGLRLRSGTAK